MFFTLGYAVVLFGDLSTHFSNDYYDADLDRSARRKTLGSSYILVKHPGVRPFAKALAVILTATSLFAAFSLVMLGSSPSLLVIVAVTNLFGWFYTAPPVRLNARRLGEVTIALGTGFVVPSVGYLVTFGVIDKTFLNFSIPLVLYGFILSLSLELPDLETDREAGRNNLVVMLGRGPVALLIFLLSIAATVILTLLAKTDLSTLWVVPLISAAPLVAGLNTLLKRPNNFVDADHISVLNILALSLFLVALDSYLLISLQ
jgi:1,4-dihydroxy-2-naphthoate octaprenyltransferase